MKVIIQTQTYENYGAHAWDGEGKCPSYWKPKGSDTFIFTCHRSHLHDLPALVSKKGDLFIEVILEIIEIEEAFFNVRDYCKEWESPTFIERGIDCWLAQRVTVNEFGVSPESRRLIEKCDWTRQSWIHGKAQSRTGYKFEACLDGELMGWPEYLGTVAQKAFDDIAREEQTA